MVAVPCPSTEPGPPPAYHRAVIRRNAGIPIDALTPIRAFLAFLLLAYVGWLYRWLYRIPFWILAGAVAIIPCNPERTANRPALPPTWTRAELGKGSSIERFFRRVFLLLRLQWLPVISWTVATQQVALTYTTTTRSGQTSFARQNACSLISRIPLYDLRSTLAVKSE